MRVMNYLAAKVFCAAIFSLLPVVASALDDSPDELSKINKISTSVVEKGKITTVVKVLSDISTTTTMVTLAQPGFSGSVRIHGRGGAPMFQVLQDLEEDQNPQNHADIWIIQGGVNDIKWFYNPSYPSSIFTEYQDYLGQIASYARDCGAVLYFQEMTPVVPDMINQWDYWMGLDVPGKIPRLNTIIHNVAATYDVGVISLYDDFLPNWVNWNSGGSSVHPNTIGIQHLAEAWAEGIRSSIRQSSSVYIGGDSITALVSSGLVVTDLNNILLSNAVPPDSWIKYE